MLPRFRHLSKDPARFAAFKIHSIVDFTYVQGWLTWSFDDEAPHSMQTRQAR